MCHIRTVPSAALNATGSCAKWGLISRFSVYGPSAERAVAWPRALFGRHAANPHPCSMTAANLQ